MYLYNKKNVFSLMKEKVDLHRDEDFMKLKITLFPREIMNCDDNVFVFAGNHSEDCGHS